MVVMCMVSVLGGAAGARAATGPAVAGTRSLAAAALVSPGGTTGRADFNNDG
jgi:hypothetical protein